MAQRRRGQTIARKNEDDIRRIRDAGTIIARIFDAIGGASLEGVSTLEVDSLVEDLIMKSHARPAFKTVVGYDHATCISVNEEVVHGIPSKKKLLRKGDILKVDIGVVKKGYFADACRTFTIDPISEDAARLVSVTRQSLEEAITEMYPGKRLGDIGARIQEYAEWNGFSVVREFTGHGVGFALHEHPNVPHYGIRGSGKILEPGMVLAVEPMLNQGGYEVITLKDGWTTVTEDGKLSAQFEDTIAITEKGPQILTRE
ncbi:MAG: type I methionyl aminopeptidase [Spirochaetota bacterium]